ncbi:MAG: helix-turn-helix domain-containing protein [Planctomycetes bacterium]|nr:helix-turn-helix domain-containing protein [Planctomycetota bacterium]
MIALLMTLSMVAITCCVLPSGSADAGRATEALLTISQVCDRVPGARRNRRISPSTATRWILFGCPARNGQRVRLAATRVGGRWLVHPAALEEFFVALANTDPVSQSPTQQRPPRSEAQRSAASEAAARELKRRGA